MDAYHNRDVIDSKEHNGNKLAYEGLIYKRNCRHFLDYKPCAPHKKFGVVCKGCPYHEPIGKKILLINLEAIGDVLRTTSVLLPLKGKYPGCSIIWLTTQKSIEILRNNPHIDRIMAIGYEASLQLMVEEYDILINLDKAHEAAAIATLAHAKEKKGFVLGKDGMIEPLSPAAKYFMDIGFSDRLKRASKKTQQEIVFDICEIPYNREKTILNLSTEATKFADRFFEENGITNEDFVVGFNTGCSNRLFVDRKWTVSGYVALAGMLHKVGAKIMLLGGPNEIERNQEIIAKSGVPIINSGNSNSLEEFAALIRRCNLLVTGDTLAVHIAAAFDVPLVVIFGNVIPAEIELYGNGKVVQTDMECWGCYKYKCEFKRICMDRISAEQVYSAIQELLKEKKIKLAAMA